MKEPQLGEVITDAEGRHYRFFKTVKDFAEAKKICESLIEKAEAQPGTNTLEDGQVELFLKVEPLEEVHFTAEEVACGQCPKKASADCNLNCETAVILNNASFHAQRGSAGALAMFEYYITKLKEKKVVKI